MKKLILIPLFILAACSARHPINSTPQPIIQKVAVCSASVDRKTPDIDKAKPGLRLEEQNTVMRKSLAQLKEYVIELEASFVECGGKIK